MGQEKCSPIRPGGILSKLPILQLYPGRKLASKTLFLLVDSTSVRDVTTVTPSTVLWLTVQRAGEMGYLLTEG